MCQRYLWIKGNRREVNLAKKLNNQVENLLNYNHGQILYVDH